MVRTGRAKGHQAAATALAVVIFAACRVYQLTPWKDRRLARCRSPLGFAFTLAPSAGAPATCGQGCTTAPSVWPAAGGLMALLVAFGLMNVIAMVVLAAAVLT